VIQGSNLRWAALRCGVPLISLLAAAGAAHGQGATRAPEAGKSAFRASEKEVKAPARLNLQQPNVGQNVPRTSPLAFTAASTAQPAITILSMPVRFFESRNVQRNLFYRQTELPLFRLCGQRCEFSLFERSQRFHPEQSILRLNAPNAPRIQTTDDTRSGGAHSYGVTLRFAIPGINRSTKPQ